MVNYPLWVFMALNLERWSIFARCLVRQDVTNKPTSAQLETVQKNNDRELTRSKEALEIQIGILENTKRCLFGRFPALTGGVLGAEVLSASAPLDV